jgi:AcrR family transcriptional regulator
VERRDTSQHVKRRYESPARARAAAGTRARIRAAAAERFVRDGYGNTSMRAIAAAAGVAERTVYLAFPTKALLLAECIRVAVRGDDEATPFMARERQQAILAAPPDRMLDLLADSTAELMDRAAALLAVGEGIARGYAALSEVRDRGRAATRADMQEIAEALGRAGAVEPGLTAEAAADVMYTLAASESVFLRLTAHRGWSREAYARTLERALVGALYGRGAA